jgi:hypothetical protein
MNININISVQKQGIKKLLAVALILVMLCIETAFQKQVMGSDVGSEPKQKDLWASPRELRNKKIIGTGIYSSQPLDTAITPSFLVDHPGFTSSHPFDGVTVVAPLDSKWCIEQGFEAGIVLDDLVWTKKVIPYSAVQETIAKLKQISWESLTDNFLWYGMKDGSDYKFAVDFTQDSDWEAVEHNASLSARICREAGLKGFMLDTEQYKGYQNNGGAYPMGKDTPEVLRQRGRQWIEAVQTEYPAIIIIIFFAWSPDLDQAEFLAGIKHFLNGVLEGIKEPAQLIHAYENTFYYGQIAGSRYTNEGFQGDRARYQSAKDSMKEWRSFSTNPDKYDKFVKVGMAAWVESDPWDLWNGWASGSKDTIWSNLPLALAYSDEYVWVWSEHTNYVHSYIRGTGPNPFLVSLNNQTFNTGKEALNSITEDFTTNPLLRGWYFDFDMLDVSRKVNPLHDVPIFSAGSVPYVWSPEDQAVKVLGTWMTGQQGDVVADMGYQRRRYVHPIQPLTRKSSFQAELDFEIERFGSDPTNPIVLGLFNSDQLVNRQSFTLQIGEPDTVIINVAGNQESSVYNLAVKDGLKAGITYRVTFNYDSKEERFHATIKDSERQSVIGQVDGSLTDRVGQFELDEIGLAQWDVNETRTPLNKAYLYHLKRVKLGHKQ